MPTFHGAHIAVNEVTHRYRRGGPVTLENLNLTIEPGQSVALIGRSGCGKSTLLHIMAGLGKSTRGSVLIDGALVDAPSPSWVMMFQQPSLLPWLTVAQNVGLGLKFARRGKESRTVVSELLGLVELADYAERNVQDLSGGQQQRVALARSLALEPQALFLDEPFSALDAFTRASLQRDVRRIVQERGMTLVLVTHDINEAALMAERAVIMAANPGRIVADLPIDRAAWQGGEPFQQARKQLQDAYEQAAGSTIAAIETGVAIPATKLQPQASVVPRSLVPAAAGAAL